MEYVFVSLIQTREISKVLTRIKLVEEIFTKSKYVQTEVLKVPLSETNRSVWGRTLNRFEIRVARLLGSRIRLSQSEAARWSDVIHARRPE